MIGVAYMLLGAFLVAIGVVASALADRIRGLRFARAHMPRAGFLPTAEATERELAPAPRRPRGTPANGVSAAPSSPKHRDLVIAALTGAGYGKPQSASAADACSEADRATAERWTAAALRKLARGEV